MAPQGDDPARPRFHPFHILSAPRALNQLHQRAALAPTATVSGDPWEKRGVPTGFFNRVRRTVPYLLRLNPLFLDLETGKPYAIAPEFLPRSTQDGLFFL